MNKEEIQKDDIVEFVTGKKATVGEHILWILQTYYREDLTCITNPDYDIVKIYRPRYELIHDRNLPTR